MENRIKIGDVWYVREDTIKPTKEKRILDFTWFTGCIVETDDYCWEVTRTSKDNYFTEYYPDVNIKFTDKTEKTWKDEHWDSNSWMIGVLENDPDSMLIAEKLMNEQGIEDFKQLIEKLIIEGWIKQKQ